MALKAVNFGFCCYDRRKNEACDVRRHQVSLRRLSGSAQYVVPNNARKSGATSLTNFLKTGIPINGYSEDVGHSVGRKAG